jgi:hypothetical protein
MTDRKTAADLAKLGAAVVNGDEDVLEAVGHLCRHLAAVEEEREAAMDPADRPCLDCGKVAAEMPHRLEHVLVTIHHRGAELG